MCGEICSIIDFEYILLTSEFAVDEPFVKQYAEANKNELHGR